MRPFQYQYVNVMLSPIIKKKSYNLYYTKTKMTLNNKEVFDPAIRFLKC